MQIHNYQNDALIPKCILTVFRSFVDGSLYLESAPINKQGKEYKVGESVPADMDMLTDLVASIKTVNFKSLKFKGLIPFGVVYVNAENADPVIVWWRPEERRHLEMRRGVGKTGTYTMPPMLFACSNGNLQVFRMEHNKVQLDDPLYYVPLPNIYESSTVCLGSVGRRLKSAKTLEAYMEAMEMLFYATDFNALHHKKFGEGVVYVDLINKFDLNLFPKVPAEQLTIKNLLNELS